MNTQPPRERDPLPRFIGWGLMAISVLWTLVSGVCAIWGLASMSDGGFFVALIGLVSGAAGVGVFFIGRMLARN
ncbi:MAG: hypothetical protein GC190_11825 [Alphaproteobacteria bacterium]|nr:hypothetical protein [Alphaproteobacteria bacterium]